MTNPTVSPASPSTRPPWLVPLVPLVAITALAVALTVSFAVGRHDNRTSVGAEAQLANMHSSCQNWSRAGRTTSEDDWCTDMVTWMRSKSMDGPMGERMGTRMWDRPDRLRESCRLWAKEQAVDTAARCDDMVRWMVNHPRRGHGGWMMDES